MKQKIRKIFSHHTSRITHYRSRGFTLIELAMVLVVIGLLIGLGASMLGPLTKRGKLIEAREAVKTAKEAVLGYAVKNGNLPADLESAGARKLDAWGRNIAFYRASEISSGNACGVNSTTIQVYECTSGDCSTYNIKSNIAFIIYSIGEDANGAGTGTVSPFYIRIQGSPYTDAGRNYEYDDISAYVSLDEIRALRGCPQPLEITSPDTLTTGEEDSFYSYSLQATGGMPPYDWTGTVSGLTLSSAGLISGTINVNAGSNTGELTACFASISVNATVKDSAGSPPKSRSVTIPVRPKPLTIITQSLPSAYEGSPYSATITVSGGRTPYSWNISVSPSCPTGLTCSGNAITGTPITGAAGTYTVISTVNDTCTTNTRNFALTINPSGGGGGGCPLMALTPPSGTNWSATVGMPFSQSVTVSGGQSPTTNTQCTPATCGGLTLSCSASGATISGTPSSASTCSFNTAWRDSCAPTPQTTSGTYLVNITGLPPSCTLSASPGIVRYGQTTQLSWSITNGPANGSFSPSGTCPNFLNSTGGSCTTSNLTSEGANNIILTISNAYGINTCSTTIYAGCQNYRAWNQTGATQDFTIDATCRNNLGNNAEITQTGAGRYLNVGESIGRHSSIASNCSTAIAQTLTYDNAMNVDIIANGGNGNCQINFTLTGAQDR